MKKWFIFVMLGGLFLSVGSVRADLPRPPATPLTIRTSASPTNGGTTSGGGPYSAGRSATVAATAAWGYRFVKWTENGVTVSASASYKFTVAKSRTLVANFAKKAPPNGFFLIPAGTFLMGDVNGNGFYNERPVHTVTESAFYMEATLVTKAEWDEVYLWAVGRGYSFGNAGSGKESDHPVQMVNWYDVVKWCNARSEKDGLTICYTAGGTVYRSGQGSLVCNWKANGYRLPTEAEWEKAARGGLYGRRFPWGDTISGSQANYKGYPAGYSYDLGPNGYNLAYGMGGLPFTSPVEWFPPNGYGLHDMAGNVWEWCWDWNASYRDVALNDPTGPASGSRRVLRGGSWANLANNARVAYRNADYPVGRNNSYGFRCVRR